MQEYRESLFFDRRTQQFLNNISTELLELVMMQSFIYYSVIGDLTETTDDIYGESQNKTFRQPIQLYGRILYNEPIVVSGTFSSENQYSLGLYLQHDRIEDDLKLRPKMGDYLQFGEKYYEVTTVKYPQMIGGLPQFQLGVILDCISVRQNVFNPEKQGPFDPSVQGDSTVNI
jgi:hypothetical protein